MNRSAANPFKLSRYSSDGLELVQTLEGKSREVSEAIGTLSASSSPYVPRLGDAPATLEDLVGDWFHLDEFVGDVANGFFGANQYLQETPLSPEQMDGMVLTIDDDTLARQGQVGYADRDEAIAAANAMADELERLREEGASDEDIQDFVAMAGRGQYDPAFAVTFSERVGVEGYADATAMIRAAYEQSGNVPPEGIAAVQVLSTTLTTALDTRPGIDDVDRHDLSNRDLPDDMRLGDGFVEDLTGDYVPGSGTDYPAPTEFDVSVLLRFADPPTEVAVEIANARMTPRLANEGYQWDVSMGAPNPWGEHGGLVPNYATMLSRNDDASAQWLASGRNIELVLAREGGYDTTDGGQAVADLVETGLTHWDEDQRRPIMERAIDAVGGDQDEIRNPWMYDALAAGVESNIDLIADRATEVTLGTLGDTEGSGATPIHNTHDFLRELMGEDRAAARVYSATLDYMADMLGGVGPGDEYGNATTRIGAVTSPVTEADANAEVGSAEERAARRQAFLDGTNRVADSVIGLLPGGGTVSSLTGDGLGWGADFFLQQFEDTDSVNSAYEDVGEFRKATQDAITAALANHEYAVSDMTSGDVLGEIGVEPGGESDFFAGDPDDDKRPIIPIEEMSDEQLTAYRQWLSSGQVNDAITNERTQVGQASDNIQELVEGRT